MEPMLLRAVVVIAMVAVVVLLGRWWRRVDGRTKTSAAAASISADDLAAVGLDLSGSVGGALLFGSASCAPCTTVKRQLADLARERDGFRWVDVDVADHLALARAHRVMRVPTVVMLAPSGLILARTSGVPNADDLRQVLDGRCRGESFDGVAV